LSCTHRFSLYVSPSLAPTQQTRERERHSSPSLGAAVHMADRGKPCPYQADGFTLRFSFFVFHSLDAELAQVVVYMLVEHLGVARAAEFAKQRVHTETALGVGGAEFV